MAHKVWIRVGRTWAEEECDCEAHDDHDYGQEGYTDDRR